MAEIREPPTLESFFKMTWTERRRVKEQYPAKYWEFIELIKEKEIEII